MKIIIICILLFFNISTSMCRDLDSTSKSVITKGYQIGTGSEILENTLILNQPLDGIGGSTWIFEIPNNKLMILTFYWGVKPNAKPELNSVYTITSKGTVNLKKDINVEYKFHPSSDKTFDRSWIQLIGDINQHIKINIKKKYPFCTNIKTTEFIELLNKYYIKIEN